VTCLAATGSDDGTTDLWDVAAGTPLHRLPGHEGPVTGIALAPDGRRALTVSQDGTLRLWDVRTGKELSRFADYPALAGVAYAPDGKRAVTGGDDRSVRVWRLPD
jgi:WD40 repeat protein